MATEPSNRLVEWQHALRTMPSRVEPLQIYCLGFAFRSDRDQVVLIKKERPEWQAGQYNGVGGKVEDRELPKNAMVREFFEETGLSVEDHRWAERGALMGKGYVVYVYTTHLLPDEYPKTMTDEKVLFRDIGGYKNDWLPHVEGLIHLCRMSIGPEGGQPYFQLYY